MITESPQQRVIWYLARRHLGYGIDEWERLPWSTQLVYLEGLSQEFYEPDPDIEQSDDSEGLVDVEAMGARVRRLGAA